MATRTESLAYFRNVSLTLSAAADRPAVFCQSATGIPASPDFLGGERQLCDQYFLVVEMQNIRVVTGLSAAAGAPPAADG